MSNSPPAAKRVRATVDLDAPMHNNYIDIWTSPDELDENNLKTPGTLFGYLAKRAWFVRKAYIDLYDDIMNDQMHRTQIVNGTAGIGKSSFLLYVLARMRLTEKSVLLHFHRNEKSEALTMFFPAGGAPVTLTRTSPNYIQTFESWYNQIGEEESVFLVDGNVSFVSMDYPVKYITAKSPSCDIGFMEKSQNRFDRWLAFWSEEELVSYAVKTDIEDAREIVKDNMLYIGGVSRYAFLRNNAKNAIMNAISIVGASGLLKVVKTGLMAKYDQQKVVDRLIHRHPPPGMTGVYGTTFTFASEFVATRVSMALALETLIGTEELLRSFQGVGSESSMRGVLFEAYAARKLASGGSFCVKEIETGNENCLVLPATTILQKDTKTLKKTHYPPKDIQGKLVWPNPDYNMPTIDMFMLLLQTCVAFQMTVATKHGLDFSGAKAFLKYFDSVSRELFPGQSVPDAYSLYFAVPTDIYVKFSKTAQPITGLNGKILDTQEAKAIGGRLRQWIIKIE